MDSFEQVGTRSGKQTKAPAPQQRRGHTKQAAKKAVATKAPVKEPKPTASLIKAVASKSPKKATRPAAKSAASDALALRRRMAKRASARASARYNALKARTSERAHKFSLLRASKHINITKKVLGGDVTRTYKLVVSKRKLTPYAKFVKEKMATLKRDGKDPKSSKIVFPQTWSYGTPKVDYQLNCSSDAFKAFGKAWKSKTSKSTAKQDVEESIVDTASFEQKKAKKRPLSARKSSKPAKKAKKHSARK